MEGRSQEADAVRRSGGFSGRQVPLEMGTVRVGGSGRPVSAVFSAMASRRAVTAPQEAAAAPPAALSPRVTLEPHPRSPFRRKEEVSKTVVLVSQETSSSHFQVKKAAGPYPLSARSPQIRERSNRSTMNEFPATTSGRKRSFGKGMRLTTSGEDVHQDLLDCAVNESRARKHQNTLQRERSVDDLTSGDIANESAVELALSSSKVEEEKSINLVENVFSFSSNVNTAKVHSREALVLATTGAGAGTFVSSMPSLTKLRTSFTAKELALFTQRLDTPNTDDKVHTRYHVASHPTHSVAIPSSEKSRKEMISGVARNTHKRSLSSTHHHDATNVLKRESGQGGSSWRRVDTSIDHIYEDPSIDMIQLHLLHSHHTTTGQKKRKMVERERVLAAASGLREHKTEEQRRQEQALQRKLQIQKMSEAIRLQNQRAVKARTVRSAGLDVRRVRSGRHYQSPPTLPERKPLVPRLSANGKSQGSKKRKGPKKEELNSRGGVSTSILMGLTSSLATTEYALEGGIDALDATSTMSETVDKQSSPSEVTPRQPKKKKKQGNTMVSVDAEAAAQAREERRAIAREYMQLQKHSRRIWSAKAKAQSQREQEKRQQQLEILEATRLKNLRLSKKKLSLRKKQEKSNYVIPGNSSPTNITTSVNRDSRTLEGTDMTAITMREEIAGLVRNDKDIILDEPYLETENYQAMGNLKPEFDYDTRMMHSSEQYNDGLLPNHEEYTAGGDERVQKLLELREKAAALSVRLSGLRNRTSHTEGTEPTNDIFEYASGVDREINISTASGCDERHASIDSNSGNDVLPSFEGSRFASNDFSGHNNEQSDIHSSFEGVERNSEESDERHSDSSSIYMHGADENSHFLDDREITTKEEEEAGNEEEEEETNEESPRGSITSRSMIHQGVEFNHVSGIDGVYDGCEDEHVDVRSIGVYSIAVAYPHQQQTSTPETMTDLKQRMRSVSSSASSSSAASSAPSSPALRRIILSGETNESFDEGKERGEFEVAFYEQIKNRLCTFEPDAKVDDDMYEVPSTHYQGKSNDNTGSTSGSDQDPDDGHPSLPVYSLKNRGTAQVRAQHRGRSKQSDAGLMRLIRETDDSLSVINRAAKKLYKEQLDKREQKKEEELHKQMEAEKQRLLRKDMALKAVMASLNGTSSGCVEGDARDSVSEDGIHSDDEDEMRSSRYKRLEEIMEEVEKERAQEKDEENDSGEDELHSGGSDDQFKLERQQVQHHATRRNTGQRENLLLVVSPSPSSPAFWDQLVSESTGNDFENHLGFENFGRPRVKIDKSELIAQREARLREEDEEKLGHIDNPPRMHSPRTLSRRLMAAVDYQEAIYEAHVQLSVMEHAHELDAVQTDTITLAHAFKEEMENNAMTQKLALDHATLEKKFDGDMHDLLQELDTIRQGEEQEKIANTARMEQELRLANLRECSVQTEPSQHADAATSASLCVDTSTSPIRCVVDAAVQHDATEQKLDPLISTVDSNNELEYASEDDDDPYEETFEKESQVQVSLHLRDNANTSEVSSYAESPTHNPPMIAEENGSEIRSLPSDAAEDDNLDNSVLATSIVEQSIGDGVNASVVQSSIDDEMDKSPFNEARESDDDAAASVNYEDDFEASSPKMRSVVDQVYHESTVEEDVADEIEQSSSVDYRESGEVVEEEAVQENISSHKIDDVHIDLEESGNYSSQFEDTHHGDSKIINKSVLNQTFANVHKVTKTADRAPDPNKVGLPAHELDLTSLQTPDTVAAAYILDLERRKQAEESLLSLRLQTIEHKFQQEGKQLEKLIRSKQSDVRVVRELKMRKETLTMAFFAEKAIVESLKAASTARYYQDLHTFRSLSLNWPNVLSHGSDHEAIYSELQLTSQLPVAVPSSVQITPSNNSNSNQGNGDMSISAHHPEEYSDEFGSDLEDAHTSVHEESEIEKNDENTGSGSIGSEHSASNERTSGSTQLSAPSEIDEDDFEQVEKEDFPKLGGDENEQEYEDEFVSMSEDTAHQKTAVVDELEVVESDQVFDQSENASEHSDNEYDEDFVSVSENTSVQVESPTKLSSADGRLEVEMEVEDNCAADDTSVSEADAVSSEDEIAEGQFASGSCDEDVEKEEITESAKRKYSDDDFEPETLEQSELPQAVSFRSEQSSSEDSSTTKLLVAEVAALQKAAGEIHEVQTEAEDSKLARKRAQAEQLLQAKEGLLNQQKELFRQDEEKRQVDAIAKMALGVDVEIELSRAKTEITRQLANEFDALQQKYPILKPATSHGASDGMAAPAPVAPSVMSKLFGKTNVVDESSVAEDEYDGGYEAESFEEQQQGDSGDDNDEDVYGSAPEKASAVKQEKVEPSVENSVEVEDSNYEVASETPSVHSDVDADIVPSGVDEKNESIDNEQAQGGADTGGEDYDDDYENESFDEAQSASAILSDKEERIHQELTKVGSGDTHMFDKAGYDGEDAYSDEGFDSASGSYSNEKPPVFETTTTPSLPQVAEITLPLMLTDETSAKEEELVEAIESVAKQLVNMKPVDSLIPGQGEPTFAVERIANQSKVLAASVSVSLSHDLEEESLTKSIEERTARLQALRQKITDRKSEILTVQKQMRIERRKENLAAEERLLWDEMESVERLLAADEAALALSRQRNRLEILNLETKQLEHLSVGRSKQGYTPERDLLFDFDYVENADAVEHQRRCHTSGSQSAASLTRATLRGIDLLAGYAYIKVVESVNPSTDIPLAGAMSLLIADIRPSDSGTSVPSDSQDGDNQKPTWPRESLCLKNEENENKNGEDEVKSEAIPSRFSHKHGQDDQASCGSSNDDDNKSVTWDENTQASGADEVVISKQHISLFHEGEDKLNRQVVYQDSTKEQVSGLENPNVEYSSPSLDNATSDLLAGFEFVELAETVLERQTEELTVDLLADFDFVEIVRAIEMPTQDGRGGGALREIEKLPDHDYDGNEELEEKSAGYMCLGEENKTDMPDTGALSAVDNLANHFEMAPGLRSISDTAIKNKDLEKSSVVESNEAEKHAVKINALSSIKADIDGDNSSESNETNELVVERVVSLIYADLFQALEKDIGAAISTRRSAQNQPSDHEQEIMSLPDVEDKPTALSSSGLSRPVSEVGSESIDSRYTADWSIEQSPDSVVIGTLAAVDSHAEVPIADLAEDEFDSSYSVDKPSFRVPLFGKLGSNKTQDRDEIIEVATEVSPSEMFGKDSLDGTGNDVSIDESTSDLHVVLDGETVSHMTPDQCASAGSQDLRASSTTAMQSERVSDLIFATVFDEILSSELQLWSRYEFVDPTITSDELAAKPIGRIVPAESSRETTKPAPNQGPRARDRNLADRIAENLQLVDGEIQLPSFHTLEIGEASSTSHVIYESISSIARDCFNAIQQLSSTENIHDDASSVLAVIRCHVQTEVDKLLAIREHSDRELERQLQQLSDDPEADGGINGDVLLSYNCVASNVSNIVSKVQSKLSRTGEALSTAVQTTRSGLLPRTPISRAKSTSILSSLQTQQDQELQQRITGMILSDLLRDAEL